MIAQRQALHLFQGDKCTQAGLLAGARQLDAVVIQRNFSLAIYGQKLYPESRLQTCLSALWESSRQRQKILTRQNQDFSGECGRLPHSREWDF